MPDYMLRAVGVLHKGNKGDDVYAAALVRNPFGHGYRVLTAAHVVHLCKPTELHWKIPNRNDAKSTIAITEIKLYKPNVNPNNVASADLALLTLADRIEDSFVPFELCSTPPYGSVVRFVGTGGTRDRQSSAGRGARQYKDFLLGRSSWGDGPTTRIGAVNDSGGPFIWGRKVFAVLHDQHESQPDYDTWAVVPREWAR